MLPMKQMAVEIVESDLTGLGVGPPVGQYRFGYSKLPLTDSAASHRW